MIAKETNQTIADSTTNKSQMVHNLPEQTLWRKVDPRRSQGREAVVLVHCPSPKTDKPKQ